jgi:hypothetical protein
MDEKEITCPVCGARFKPKNKCQNYCCSGCYQEANRIRGRARYYKNHPVEEEGEYLKVCKICGAHFTGTGKNEMYCHECKLKPQSTPYVERPKKKKRKKIEKVDYADYATLQKQKTLMMVGRVAPERMEK